MKTTAKFMTANPKTIRENASLTEAYRTMQELSVRHLPVLDENLHVVGILSNRDLQRAMTIKKFGPIQQTYSFHPDLRVEDFMSWPVYVVADSTPLKLVAEQMLAQKVSAFVVENANGALCGIITTDDILRVFLLDQTKTGETPLKGLAHYFLDPEAASSTL